MEVHWLDYWTLKAAFVLLTIYLYNKEEWRLRKCAFCRKRLGFTKSHGKDRKGWWHYDCYAKQDEGRLTTTLVYTCGCAILSQGDSLKVQYFCPSHKEQVLTSGRSVS